jgi:hypothetical protein
LAALICLIFYSCNRSPEGAPGIAFVHSKVAYGDVPQSFLAATSKWCSPILIPPRSYFSLTVPFLLK